MNYNQFYNVSCYEEFEILCTLTGISKVDVLKEIGYKVDDYYFFISNDGIFNWFDLNGNNIENPGILKELKEEHIPENITKCIIPNSVICIGKEAFSYCESLTSINIPDSVTYIGDHAFDFCYSLTSIVIPNSVTSIGDYAFYFCYLLKEINIPNNVTSIGYAAFSFCKSLTSINIPDSVISIGKCAFYGCESLISITIPDSVRNIGHWAFYNCISLKEVVFKGKTLEEVKQMENYPFGIKDESVIKVSKV